MPADVRLLESRELRIDEAMLTGESVPSRKSSEPVAPDTALATRHPWPSRERGNFRPGFWAWCGHGQSNRDRQNQRHGHAD